VYSEAPRAAPAIDRTPTGTVKPVAEPSRGPASDGWSAEGGRVVTLKDGESLGTLSNRYGVPVKAIINANGFADANSVRSGQRVIIPVYSYARAGGATGSAKAPENVAVAPSQPKAKEQDARNLAASEPASGKGVYTVVSGDTFYSVARKTGASVDQIRNANGLDKSSMLKIGQKLKVPAAGAAVIAAAPKAVAPAKTDNIVTGTAAAPKVVATTEPKAVAEKPKLSTYTPPVKGDDSAIKAAVAASDEAAPDATGIGKMRWPVRGRVVSSYASGGDGIDIAVPEGTPVKAAENGVVIFAGEGLKDFGRTVLVRHSDGKVTVYGHTSEINVKRGDTVRRGQEIARSGMTGSTDTPKLHFEVRENSKAVDPQKFLE
ncbi:MAG: peptidoglycan DD-metalloendopeptidase family protein, partial [Mesorhizobium sp.]